MCQVASEFQRPGVCSNPSLPRDLVVYDDMMWNCISALLSPYLEKVAHQVHQLREDHYVTPSLKGLKQGTDPVRFLADFCSGELKQDSNIVVIKANPGIGKTALATMVARELSAKWDRARVVPLFLPADIWRTIGPANLIDVLNEMKFPLSNDEDGFSRLLQQGYVALIFDGFDELHDKEQTPRERFQWLRNIAADSSARIMVTVRSSFWEREIAGPDIESDLMSFLIEPFSKEDRNSYWRKRLSDDTQVQKAARMLGKYTNSVGGADIELFHLPNSASMIADCVELADKEQHSGDPENLDLEMQSNDRDLVDRFFREVMERERIRQGLETSTSGMRSALEEISVIYKDDEHFDEDMLQLGGLIERDLERVRDHAFLNHQQPGSFRFRYAVVPQRFRSAKFLSAALAGKFDQQARGDFATLISDECDGSGELPTQVARIVTDEELPGLAKVHTTTEDSKLKSLIFHILATRVFSAMQGESKAARWLHLVRLLGGSRTDISGLCIRGTVDGFNIDEFTIRNSRFFDFTLNTRAKRLKFDSCSFEGSLSVPERTRFENCTPKGESKLVVDWAEQGRRLDEEDFRSYLRTCLKRFDDRAGGFKVVREDDWNTGEVGRIESTFGVLEELVGANVVERDSANGRSKLSLTNEGLRWVARFLNQGSLQGGLRNVIAAMQRRVRNHRRRL